MERYEYVKELVLRLLVDSPLISEEVTADVRHLVAVGEEELAFRTMCSWIYEDDLEISAEYYARLVVAGVELGESASVGKLTDLAKGEGK